MRIPGFGRTARRCVELWLATLWFGSLASAQSATSCDTTADSARSAEADDRSAAACAAPPVFLRLTGGARSAYSANRHDYLVGAIDADHDDDYEYRLPYADGVSYPVLQSYGARFSHRGGEHFTVDFRMDEGTPVHAAREGIVALVEDRHAGGCSKAECGELANFVVVLHSDGTTGEYFHLAQGSSVVVPGQKVERGQMLARSGNTGFTTVPHLHFGVYRTDHSGATRSIAVRFATLRGPITVPRTGARYLNPPEEEFRAP